MFKRALVGGLVVCFWVSVASAATILDTMDSTTTGTDSFRSNVWLGHKFNTGDNGATVRSLTIDYDISSQLGSWEQTVVGIYAADGADSRPGTLIDTFDFYSRDADVIVFGGPGCSASLDSNSSYWIGFTTTISGGNTYFQKTDPTNIDYTGSLSGYAFATTGNYVYGPGDGSWNAPFSYTYASPMLELSDVVVPEPATLSLLTFGGAAMLLRKRRK